MIESEKTVHPLLAFPDRTLNPEQEGRIVTRDARALVVAEFRRLADALENHELDGARIQWRDDHNGQTEMQTVTLTADAESKGGTVQLLTKKITELKAAKVEAV